MASHLLVSPTMAVRSNTPPSALFFRRHGLKRTRIAEQFRGVSRSAPRLVQFFVSSESSTLINARDSPDRNALTGVDPALAVNALQSQPKQLVPDLSGDLAQAVKGFQSQPQQLPGWKFLQRVAMCVLANTIGCVFLPRSALAVAENSIGASSLGIKVAEVLRGSGLSDEMVVFTVAMLPVLELRGAIPISYWLKLDPLKGYILAVLGNMVPVPFIVLYLEKISKYVKEGSGRGQRFMSWLFKRTREKAGPIEEFQWLGLMLFVAVPAPGTGAWTGAIAAAILGMSFWDAMTANLVGVVMAGLLVNLVVTVGVKEACLVAGLLGCVSFFMWSALRAIQRKKKSTT